MIKKKKKGGLAIFTDNYLKKTTNNKPAGYKLWHDGMLSTCESGNKNGRAHTIW